MATRMQQRRGTATMWTNANPILGVAEIGYETDTNKFKIGDGTNRWADLTYFQDSSAISALIDGAPDLLNTLNELATSLGDNPDFVGSVTSDLALKAPINNPTFTGTVAGVTKSMVGLGNVNNTSDADKPVSTATQTALDLKANSSDITELSQDAVNAALTAGSGITKTYNDAANTITVAVDSTIATKTYADGAVSTAVGALTKSSVGLANVDNTSDANKPVSTATQTALDAKASNTALANHEADTTNIHGIADTSALATKTYADNAASTAVAAVIDSAPGALDTLNELAAALNDDASYATTITNALALKAPLASPTFTGTVSGVTKAHVGLGNADNTSDAAKPVSTAAQTALDLKANLAGPTFTGTVSGITKSMVGLGSVDNTADSAKPISTATQTALDLKLASATAASTYAPLAGPTFTGTVSGVTKSMVGLANVDNTTDAGKPVSTAQQTALDLKANLAGPTFTGTVSGITKSMVGLGSVDNTADTAKPISTATQTALNLKLNAADMIDGGGV